MSTAAETTQTTTPARPAPPTLKVVTEPRPAAKKSPAKKTVAQTTAQPPRVTAKLLAELKKRWYAKVVYKHSGNVDGLVVRTSAEKSRTLIVRELFEPERRLLLEGPSDTMTQQSALNLLRLLQTTMKRPVVHQSSGRPKTGRGAWDPATREFNSYAGTVDESKPLLPSEKHSGNPQLHVPSPHGQVIPNKKKQGKK